MEFIVSLFWTLVGLFIVYQGFMFAVGFFIFLGCIIFYAIRYIVMVIVNGVKNT